MADMIPDLTHYVQGLDSASFPLKVATEADKSDALTVHFTVVTLEHYIVEIALNGQGFRVVTLSTAAAPVSTPLSSPQLRTENRSEADTALSSGSSTPIEQPLSARQQEASLGMVYETIEALLMAVSPGFEEFFGQELARKLESVLWDRFQYQQDEGDSDNEDLED
ncbi:hypothetical protein BC939DRAFT_502672 [Gamsiella multidivaricata]|uniref:uncharacterized protein n=1 Tax=Gamsiella multidivaricata TaxID=101098 RepID=UPI00221E51C4|nr:uncharacterized protein BC939DRAFT_502672 [Gamsiella multidivaricata]KAG0371395.1 hypothetical protein BGZ54_000022 [Gamsiella multidivaricata]KAI7824693.1 hypothetical protein BC939DRAFT_502672 [Gamsiella multidivaricata]